MEYLFHLNRHKADCKLLCTMNSYAIYVICSNSFLFYLSQKLPSHPHQSTKSTNHSNILHYTIVIVLVCRKSHIALLNVFQHKSHLMPISMIGDKSIKCTLYLYIKSFLNAFINCTKPFINHIWYQ